MLLFFFRFFVEEASSVVADVDCEGTLVSTSSDRFFPLAWTASEPLFVACVVGVGASVVDCEDISAVEERVTGCGSIASVAAAAFSAKYASGMTMRGSDRIARYVLRVSNMEFSLVAKDENDYKLTRPENNCLWQFGQRVMRNVLGQIQHGYPVQHHDQESQLSETTATYRFPTSFGALRLV